MQNFYRPFAHAPAARDGNLKIGGVGQFGQMQKQIGQTVEGARVRQVPRFLRQAPAAQRFVCAYQPGKPPKSNHALAVGLGNALPIDQFNVFIQARTEQTAVVRLKLEGV